MTVELRKLSDLTANKERIVYIDGKRAGRVDRESFSPANTLDGSKKKLVAWSGHFEHDGKRHSIGRTDKISEIIPKIERIMSRAPIDESVFVEGLGDMVKGGISNIADRARWAFKDHGARGRLDLRAATKHLFNDWKAYIGRKQQAGNPAGNNLATLSAFLKFQYGIEIDPAELIRIAGGKEAAPAPAEEKPALQATTTEEYNALRRSVTGRAVFEEAVLEDTPEEATFDPKILFPKLADMLIDHGLMAVTRNGEVTGGSRQPQKPADKSSPLDTNGDGKIDPQVTEDGHSIDAKKLAEWLETDKITKDQMDAVRKILNSAGETAFERRIGRPGSETGRVVASIVNATLKSISKTNDPNKQIAPSVTASGNTVSILAFKDALAKDGINGKHLDELRNILQSDGEGGLVKAMQQGGQPRKTIVGVTNAMLTATSHVADKKKKPAAAPAAATAPEGAAAPEA